MTYKNHCVSKGYELWTDHSHTFASRGQTDFLHQNAFRRIPPTHSIRQAKDLALI